MNGCVYIRLVGLFESLFVRVVVCYLGCLSIHVLVCVVVTLFVCLCVRVYACVFVCLYD